MRCAVLVLLLLSSFVLANPVAALPSFQGLDPQNSIALRISDDASTVVGRSTPNPVRWVDGAPAEDLTSGFSGMGFDVTPNGDVIVGYYDTAIGLDAFRWTEATGPAPLGHLHGPDSLTVARGVSADGSMVVGHDCAAGLGDRPCEAFTWTEAGGIVGQGNLLGGGDYSQFNAISGDGSIAVGSSRSSFGREVIRWTPEGGMVGLGIIGGAHDISTDGSTIVGAEGSSSLIAFAWRDGEVFDPTEPLGGSSNTADGVSADGSVIVGSYDIENPAAYVWREGVGASDLQVLLVALGLADDLAGWTLESAESVSADGMTIVGYGTNPDGVRQAFIATVPEPSITAALGVALMMIVGLAARRRTRALALVLPFALLVGAESASAILGRALKSRS
jgi:uncharacterized membrane protein